MQAVHERLTPTDAELDLSDIAFSVVFMGEWKPAQIVGNTLTVCGMPHPKELVVQIEYGTRLGLGQAFKAASWLQSEGWLWTQLKCIHHHEYEHGGESGGA